MAQKRNAKTDPATAGIKVIATRSCSTLSGTGTLTYKLGVDEKKGLYLRIHENSGGGFFDDSWYSATGIAHALRDHEGKESLTSLVLLPVFQGRSANRPQQPRIASMDKMYRGTAYSFLSIPSLDFLVLCDIWQELEHDSSHPLAIWLHAVSRDLPSEEARRRLGAVQVDAG